MPYKKISALDALTAITDDDLLVVVNSPASGPGTRRITWAEVLAYFATGVNTLTLSNQGLHLQDTNGSHDLIVKPGSDLTADRVLTLTTGDAARALTFTADVTVSAATSITAALTVGGATSITGGLTVESASYVNQDLTTDANPTFAGVLLTKEGGPANIAGTVWSDPNYSSSVTFRRARGTTSAPTAVTSGSTIGYFGFEGHNGSAFSGSCAAISVLAAGTFSTTSYPTRITFSVTPVGSTTLTEAMRIDPSGNIGVGQTTFGSSATKTLAMGSGTAPSSSPADAFQMYSADFAAGNACPHFLTENGTVIVLNQDLKTTASPQFAGLGVNSAASATVRLTLAGGTVTGGSFGVASMSAPNWVVGAGATESHYGTGITVSAGQCDIAATGVDNGYRAAFLNYAQIDDADFQGTLTNQYGILSYTGINSGSGTITSCYGLYLGHFNTTGTIVNAWGVYQQSALCRNYFAGNVGLGQTTFGTNATKTLAVGSGVAPASSPADAFQIYSADFAAGNACPTFLTENGTVIVLNQDLKTTASPVFASLGVNVSAITHKLSVSNGAAPGASVSNVGAACFSGAGANNRVFWADGNSTLSMSVNNTTKVATMETYEYPSTADSILFAIQANGGNVGLCGALTVGTSAKNNLQLKNGTAPSGSYPADSMAVYAKDISDATSPDNGKSALHLTTEAGSVVKLYQQAAVADTSGAALAALEAEVNKLKAILRKAGLMAT